MTGIPRFERPDADEVHVPATGDSTGARVYDPAQTRRRFRDLKTFDQIVWDVLATFVPSLLRGLGLDPGCGDDVALPAALS